MFHDAVYGGGHFSRISVASVDHLGSIVLFLHQEKLLKGEQNNLTVIGSECAEKRMTTSSFLSAGN